MKPLFLVLLVSNSYQNVGTKAFASNSKGQHIQQRKGQLGSLVDDGTCLKHVSSGEGLRKDLEPK